MVLEQLTLLLAYFGNIFDVSGQRTITRSSAPKPAPRNDPRRAVEAALGIQS